MFVDLVFPKEAAGAAIVAARSVANVQRSSMGHSRVSVRVPISKRRRSGKSGQNAQAACVIEAARASLECSAQ
jgi:hypothetical protein